MQTSGNLVYLDSSALVKLVLREAESAALASYLASRPDRISCALARVEVVRAVQFHEPGAAVRAASVLSRVRLIGLHQALLDSAARLSPPELRSLDAIHLAAALLLGGQLAAVVSYDRRMLAAAPRLGLRTASPSP